MMTRGILRPASQLFENTFVKVATCRSISPLSSKEQRSLLRQTWINIWPNTRNTCVGQISLVWEQGTRNNQGQLEISGGSKGIVTFDMVVKSAEVDIHSSYGGVVDSASWYLLNAIASLRDKEGRILVDGIYDQIQEPNERELALIEAICQQRA